MQHLHHQLQNCPFTDLFTKFLGRVDIAQTNSQACPNCSSWDLWADWRAGNFVSWKWAASSARSIKSQTRSGTYWIIKTKCYSQESSAKDESSFAVLYLAALKTKILGCTLVSPPWAENPMEAKESPCMRGTCKVKFFASTLQAYEQAAKTSWQTYLPVPSQIQSKTTASYTLQRKYRRYPDALKAGFPFTQLVKGISPLSPLTPPPLLFSAPVNSALVKCTRMNSRRSWVHYLSTEHV